MIAKSLYFGNPARLSLKLEQLLVEKEHEGNWRVFGQVPVSDIGILVLDNPQITITHPLLTALLKVNAVVISCDEKHLPLGALQAYYSHTTHTETLRAQLAANKPLMKRLWGQTVAAKIGNQAGALDWAGGEVEPLIRWSREVKSGDPTNLEARAAAYYWPRFFDGDSPFIRERFGEAPNNALNFGYAILRSMVARALVATGLHPAYGIFHRNKYNPHCLADDIMEPYRPFLDALVMRLHNEYGAIEVLGKEHKAHLLELPMLDVRFGKRISPLGVGVQRTAASLARCFRGEDQKILYPQWME